MRNASQRTPALLLLVALCCGMLQANELATPRGNICADFENCWDCTNDGCFWGIGGSCSATCAENDLCVSNSTECVNCDDATECTECGLGSYATEVAGYCVWCEASETCFDQNIGCECSTECTTESWTEFCCELHTDCDSCVSNCNWCVENESCYPTDECMDDCGDDPDEYCANSDTCCKERGDCTCFTYVDCDECRALTFSTNFSEPLQCGWCENSTMLTGCISDEFCSECSSSQGPNSCEVPAEFCPAAADGDGDGDGGSDDEEDNSLAIGLGVGLGVGGLLLLGAVLALVSGAIVIWYLTMRRRKLVMDTNM